LAPVSASTTKSAVSSRIRACFLLAGSARSPSDTLDMGDADPEGPVMKLADAVLHRGHFQQGSAE